MKKEIMLALMNAVRRIENSWCFEDKYLSFEEREQFFCSETSGVENVAFALRDMGVITQFEVERLFALIENLYEFYFDGFPIR